jgi:hypothetical protein
MLMNLRHASNARNNAVEAASSAGGWTGDEWAAASRVWSRQGNAFLLAIIGEPPTNPEDALAVLGCLAELRDQYHIADKLSDDRHGEIAEMTNVAVQNCIVALATSIVPADEYTESEIDGFDWSAKQRSQWLPKPVDEWAELAAERARLDTAEDAAAATGNDEEADRLQALRHAAEDKLMAMPAPGGEGLALKVLIAIGQDRASIPNQEAIEADARRLAGMETLS